MLKYSVINGLALTLFVGLLILDLWMDISIYSYIGLFIVWFLITGFGSWYIEWNYHLTSLHCNSTLTQKAVAISFDDGPHPEFTPEVLQLLKKYNAKATFFLIGKNAEKYPELVSEILSEGHSIGNHTYSHAKNFGFFSTQKVISELKRTNQIVTQLTGLKMMLYRPAFGVTNPMIKRALRQLGMQSIGWNKRSYDTTNLGQKQVYRRVVKQLKKGDIILLHDRSKKTVDVLEQLLLFLQENGFNAITVNKMFGIKAYE